MTLLTEDLSLFIDVDEHAVPVVANGVSGFGIFDTPGEYIGENGIVLSIEYQVRCITSQFGGLGYDDAVTVNGQSYLVRDNRPIFDGAFCMITLSKLDAAVGATIATLFTEDLSLFIDVDEHAVPVVANGVSGFGIFDTPGEYIGENGIVLSIEYQVRCITSQFGGLGYDDAVTVNGQSYLVRDNRPIFDGAFCMITLSKLDAAIATRITTLDSLLLTTLDGRYLVTL